MFNCTECSKGFTSQGSLARHSRNHTKTTQHVCSVCNVIFYRRDLLTCHMRLHDAETMEGSPEEPATTTKRRRQRCHTACIRCRDLKIKCDGQSPCGKCSKADAICQFDYRSGRMSRIAGAGEMASPASSATPVEDSRQLITSEQDNHNPPLSDDAADASIGEIDMSLDPDFTTFVSWPWLHEELFLSNDTDALFDSTGTEHIAPLENDFSFTDMTIDDNTLKSLEPGSGHNTNHQGSTNIASLFPLPHQSAHPSTAGPVSPPYEKQALPEVSRTLVDVVSLKRNVIDELVAFTKSNDSQMGYWSLMSPKVARAFRLTPEEPSALQHFLELYLQHFHPLWPLVSRQSLELDQIHPLLFLVFTSIGAMYGGPLACEYGTQMHHAVRARLTVAMELEDNGDDLIWLAQARLLTQVAALYFGQPKAFSYAQHLGALLVAQARRMNLFSVAHCQTRMKQFNQMKNTSSDDERLNVWLSVEARRRLAFGLFRGDSFTSILLGTKPLVTLDEIDLGFPSCDAVWDGRQMEARVALEILDHDRTPSRQVRASDMYHLLLDRDEALPPLEPVGHELLLFGLQLPVWRFSFDRHTLQRLSENDREDDGCAVTENGESSTLSTLPPKGRRDTMTSEVEGLETVSRPMADLSTDYYRLMAALQKWERALSITKTLAQTSQDWSYVLSSLILYHLSYLRLHAPVEDVHQIQYRLADDRLPDADVVSRVRSWANSPRAQQAVDRACSIWSLINTESKRGSKFNILAFFGLHHGAAILWAYMGARRPSSSTTMCDRGAIEGSPEWLLQAGEESPRVLGVFVELCDKISAARWSSFVEATRLMCSCGYPREDLCV